MTYFRDTHTTNILLTRVVEQLHDIGRDIKRKTNL